MKAYTDLEQSHKLAEILPIESADMRYDEYTSHIDGTPKVGYKEGITEGIPCWSLVALLYTLPKQFDRYTKSLYWFDDAWHCEYIDEDSEGKYGVTAGNPIDACVEMIIKLNEFKIAQKEE